MKARTITYLLTVAMLILAYRPINTHAVAFSMDLTAAEVADATWKYGVAPDAGGYANVQLWGAAQFKTLIQTWHNERQLSLHDAFCTNFRALNGAGQTAACASVGLATGCSPCDRQRDDLKT